MAKKRSAPRRRAHPGMELQNLTIRREGEARWRVSGDHHCGAAASVGPDGRTAVRYVVEILCTRALDPRGFLIDQTSIDKLIHRLAKRGTEMSCEQLVERVGREVMRYFRRFEPECEARTLKVTLSPSPFLGSMTAEFW